ncbi:MAG: hypothetical protein QM793_08775 [Muricomes sp.]
MLTLSLISGLISAVCWMLGDIFLVGFDIELERHKDFLEGTEIKNKRMAVLMLSGSTPRLRFGALIANFSIPFMLCSVYSLYVMAEPSAWAIIAAILFGVGFSLSPVAHVAYYYVGTLCKTLFDEYKRSGKVSAAGESLVNEYIHFLDITWRAAIGITALGWIVYALLILFGKTSLPPLFCLFTPLTVSPLALLVSKLRIGAPYLNGAGFNVALTIFFAVALAFHLM